MTYRLITFGLSHYCEKARWALQWHGIAFEEVGWPPGLHLRLAQKAGAANSSVPILLGDGGPIQGSAEILDWLQARTADPARSLMPSADQALGRQIEQRADREIGVHVRRLIYARILPRDAHLVKPYLLMNTSSAHRLVGHLTWPVVQRLMIKAMDTTPAAVPEARSKLAAELDRLDELLTDGRPFLVGDRFSRVDLTVAALLAPAVRPEGMELYRHMTLPEPLAEDLAAWRDRPCFEWVRTIYRDHRQSSG